MDSDKLIFSIIGGITVLILVLILGSSFLKQPNSTNDFSYVLGDASNRIGPENPY